MLDKFCLVMIEVCVFRCADVGGTFNILIRCAIFIKRGAKMGKNPDLDKLNEFFEKGEDFQLTDKLYKEKTGVPLPKTKTYIKSGSALSRKAAEHGYSIIDVREEPIIVKTVYFKKK